MTMTDSTPAPVRLKPARQRALDIQNLLHEIGKAETLLKETVGDTLAFDPDAKRVWALLEEGERAELRRRTERRIPDPAVVSHD